MARVLLLRDGAAVAKRARSSVRFYQVFINRNTNIDSSSSTYSISKSRRNAVFGSRELSSSCVLRSRDQVQSDSELLRETPTFESELAASGDEVVDINTTASDLLAQTEDFAALGLGGYTPPGLVQTALEFAHNTAHLPWWTSIVAATVVLRLALFPLAVRMQVNAAKLTNINPVAAEMHKRMAAYRNIGNKVAEAQEAAKLLELYRRNGVNPITSLLVMPIVQIPIFISFFLAIKRMANLPLVSMKSGGIYWFTDLTVPDPTYFLPLLACLTFLSNVELGGEGGAASSNQTHRNVKMFMRASAILVLPISITFPSGLFMYWVTNSLFSTFQILLFKIPRVKVFFGIPKIVKPPKE